MKTCLLFVYFFVLSNYLVAQTFPFRTYSIEDGLSESVVYDIIQDSDGYIWMATGFGLNKFDGSKTITQNLPFGFHNKK